MSEGKSVGNTLGGLFLIGGAFDGIEREYQQGDYYFTEKIKAHGLGLRFRPAGFFSDYYYEDEW